MHKWLSDLLLEICFLHNKNAWKCNLHVPAEVHTGLSQVTSFSAGYLNSAAWVSTFKVGSHSWTFSADNTAAQIVFYIGALHVLNRLFVQTVTKSKCSNLSVLISLSSDLCRKTFSPGDLMLATVSADLTLTWRRNHTVILTSLNSSGRIWIVNINPDSLGLRQSFRDYAPVSCWRVVMIGLLGFIKLMAAGVSACLNVWIVFSASEHNLSSGLWFKFVWNVSGCSCL